MTGSRIRSVLLASNSSRPAFLPIHGLSVSSLLRKSEASSSRSRISRRSFATSPCPDTTNASRTSNPPYWLPRRHRWPPARPGTHVSVRPTSPPTFRHSHLTAAARTNARAHRRCPFRAVAKVKDCQHWRWEHHRI